jgi:hypothetical protein
LEPYDDNPPAAADTEIPAAAAAEAPGAPAPVDSNGVVSAKKGIRDYSAIRPEDIDAFKQMSDKAYEKAINWYKNTQSAADIESKYTKELSELRDYRFYQHPEAYRLSPEYAEAATQYRAQTAVINHWERALEQLENGEPINDIAVDDKGNVQVIPNDIPASPQLKARVSVMLQKAMAQRGAVETNLEALSTKYQTKHKEFDTQWDSAVNQLVSPKLLEDAKFKTLYNKYLTNVIPPAFQNVPVYKQNAKMAAFIQMAAQQIQVLQKRLEANSIKANAVREQGPSDGAPATGKANWMDRPVNDVLAEFENMRR